VLGRFVRGRPRQRLNFENQDQEEDEVDDDDLFVHVQDDSEPDVSCGQPSNPARQRLQNMLMRKKARTPRAWTSYDSQVPFFIPCAETPIGVPARGG
jgi:hypothetical protein